MDAKFRAVVTMLALILLLAIVAWSINCPETRWAVRDDVPIHEFDSQDFHTGDLVLVFVEGHDFLMLPGHVGIVV